MDEQTLETQLDTYKAQVTQVEQALQASGEECNPDLVQLKADLLELVQLTEGSLLSLKKSNLLSQFDDVQPSTHQSMDMDKEFAAFQAAIADDLSNSETSSSENSRSSFSHQQSMSKDQLDFDKSEHLQLDCLNDKNCASETMNDMTVEDMSNNISGMKCRVPYSQEWGKLEYHNALVLGMESVDENTIEPKIQVLFCNPTHRTMIPCPFFLDGKCKFSSDECRFSHGYLVNLADVTEFKEPDYSELKLMSKCIARYDDNVWYEAMVVDVLDNHQYKVQYSSYDEVHVVNLEDILPVGGSDNSSSSDSESDASAQNLPPNYESSDDENALPVLLWKPPQTLQALGEWETHTKGIGSKLLAKMGFIVGQGLGKMGQGRAEPVPIRLLPPGKSLDKIMELKEKAGDRCLVDVLKKEKRKKRKQEQKLIKSSENKKEATDMFDFINKKLKGKKADIHSLVKPHSKQQQPAKHITTTDLKKKSDRNVNIQLFQTHEEMKTVERKLAKLKESLVRNEGSGDKRMVIQIKQKICDLEKYMQQLQHSEKSITQHKVMRKEHKKLTIF